MAIDEQLVSAYRNARYSLTLSNRRDVNLILSRRSPELETVLKGFGFAQGAFMTPENPRSEVLSERVNAQRCRRFLEELRALGVSDDQVLEGQGGDESGDWRPEKSFFFPIENQMIADKLAKDFGQNAYLLISVDSPIELVICETE